MEYINSALDKIRIGGLELDFPAFCVKYGCSTEDPSSVFELMNGFIARGMAVKVNEMTEDEKDLQKIINDIELDKKVQTNKDREKIREQEKRESRVNENNTIRKMNVYKFSDINRLADFIEFLNNLNLYEDENFNVISSDDLFKVVFSPGSITYLEEDKINARYIRECKLNNTGKIINKKVNAIGDTFNYGTKNIAAPAIGVGLKLSGKIAKGLLGLGVKTVSNAINIGVETTKETKESLRNDRDVLEMRKNMKDGKNAVLRRFGGGHLNSGDFIDHSL